MEAAELCMRALKIATKDQKPEIRSKCQSLLNEAERIKQMPEEWVAVNHEPDLSEQIASLDLQPARANDTLPSHSPQTSSSATLSSTSGRPRSKRKPKVRLREPVSTRVLPVAEQILLLNAAKLNGFKFPPWSGPPKPEEFEFQAGEEPYK
jgi:calpain-7